MTQKKLLYIGNNLSKHGNTATSIETLGSFLELEGYKIFYASSKKNKILRLADMVWKTIRYSRKVDYVLIDTYSTQNFWYAVIISQMCRFLKLKYITKLHGGNLPQRLKLSPNLCKLIFNHAYKVTAPSNYLMEAFMENGYKDLIYIPNTIEIENYKFLERTTIYPKLLWVRSFAAIYNPMMAIKVLSNVKANFPDAELCMIGPDKENLVEECKKFAKSLNVEVTFKGKLSKEEWTDLSKNYSIFINTTHFDNAPVSVIEAMALGLPIISTNVGGIPYLLEHKKNALLVNDNDSLTMSVAVNELINNSELSTEISSNARKLVENYDWEIVKLMWFEILK